MALHTASVITEHGRTLHARSQRKVRQQSNIVDYMRGVYGIGEDVELMNETSDGRRGDVVDTIEGRRIGIYRIR